MISQSKSLNIQQEINISPYTIFSNISHIATRQVSPCSFASQEEWTLAGPAELLAPFHRDETSRLRANSYDRTMHAAAGSTSYRGVPRPCTGAPLSVGFDWTSTEEPRKTGADGFDPGYEV